MVIGNDPGYNQARKKPSIDYIFPCDGLLIMRIWGYMDDGGDDWMDTATVPVLKGSTLQKAFEAYYTNCFATLAWHFHQGYYFFVYNNY